MRGLNDTRPWVSLNALLTSCGLLMSMLGSWLSLPIQCPCGHQWEVGEGREDSGQLFSAHKNHTVHEPASSMRGGDTMFFLFQFSFALKWMAFFLHTINNACAGGAFNRTSIHHSKVAFSPKAWEQSVGKMEKPCRWDCPAAFLPGGAHWQQWKMTKKL